MYIQLHAGELRVVAAVHAFVAEVTADLIHALETAYNQPFQIQLRRDTQVHIYVQRVMMGDERTGTCAAGYLLQDRGLHLGVTCLVEHLTHRAQDRRALEERVLHAVVDNQIHITLAVTLLRVIEAVVSHAVFVFDDRQRTQRFSQNRQFLGMNAYLAHLRTEDETLDTDEIADVQQFFEYHIVHLLFYGQRRSFSLP